MARSVKVWDPAVRLFHWALVAGFAANIFFTAPGKQAHRWIGYAVLFLVLARLFWGLVGSRHARFRDFPPSSAAALDHLGEIATGRKHPHLGHSPLGALMIYNMILTFLLIGLSGWLLTTVPFFGLKWLTEAHELMVNWAEFCAVLHIAAVMLESRRLGINLPKSMVTGYKTLP